MTDIPRQTRPARPGTAGTPTTRSGPGGVGSEVSSYEHRTVNPARLAAIRAHAGHSILDVGCGSGAYVLTLAHEYAIRGVDHQIFPSWTSAPGRFAVLDADHLDGVRTSSVDTVLLFEVLEHLPDPRRALQQARRICRKNVILTVPNTELTAGMAASRLIYYHWIDRTHLQFFDRSSLEDLATSAGLRIDLIDNINPISLGPFIAEAFKLGRFATRLVLQRQRVAYEMTLLAVATPAVD